MTKTHSKPWPWNKVPEPRPADWGIGMTVCISAVCQETLISVSDRMVSMSGYFSGDNMVRKLDFIGRSWFSMIAGNDIAQAIPVHQAIRNSSPSDTPFMLEEMVKAATDAYKARRNRVIEDTILPLYGISSLEEYKTTAKQFLTEDSQYEIATSIKQCDLECELLISGFDPHENPHIVAIKNPGTCDYYDKLGFWAIGSGQQQALASLIASEFSRFDTLEEGISKVLTAKFTAESASGVGKSTFGFAYHPTKSFCWIDDIEPEVRKEWEGLPKYPYEVLDEIRKTLKPEGGELVDQPSQSEDAE